MDKFSFSFRETSDSDPSFRIDIYPNLVSHEVRRELGVAISSTPEYIWFLAYDGEYLAAFAALEPGKIAQLRHAYVLPRYRQQGLYRKLFDLRMAKAREIGAKAIRTIAAPSTAIIFKRYGFRLVQERGRYKIYEKVL